MTIQVKLVQLHLSNLCPSFRRLSLQPFRLRELLVLSVRWDLLVQLLQSTQLVPCVRLAQSVQWVL